MAFRSQASCDRNPNGPRQPAGSVSLAGTLPGFAATPTVNAAQSGAWNIGNITGTITLPSGASTSALQSTGNASLATIATNTSITAAGTSATSALPIQGVTGGVALPVSGTVAVSGSVATTLANPSTVIGKQATCAITAQALPTQSLTNGVVIKALKKNAATIYIGGASTVTNQLGANPGFPLDPGEAIAFGSSQMASIYMICGNTSDAVALAGN